MARNIIDLIWKDHQVICRDGHPSVLAIDLMLIHEVTSPQAFAELEKRGLEVFDTSSLIATIDHSTPTRKDRFVIHDEVARQQVETMRSNAKKWEIPFFDFESGNQGIVHVMGPELGLTHPGSTIVCGDSHTATHGAFGALAFGIGTSEVGFVLATGSILQRRPKTMEIRFEGEKPSDASAKDMILKLIADLGVDVAKGHIVHFTGAAISALSMEERMTICNMAIEFGARAGLISPDEVTYNYLKDRPYAPENFDEATKYWERLNVPNPTYDTTKVVDIANLKPMVTWGINPGQGIAIDGTIPQIAGTEREINSISAALAYTKLSPGNAIEGTKIDWAFLGSCTNSRLEDLRIAASLIKGRKVANHVKFYVVPGSEVVEQQAREEGLVSIFEEAGAFFRKPGCSMCLGMNDDKVGPGERCISSSNRNFMGRQGPGSITHLASPATVVASAIAGAIADPRKLG